MLKVNWIPSSLDYFLFLYTYIYIYIYILAPSQSLYPARAQVIRTFSVFIVSGSSLSVFLLMLDLVHLSLPNMGSLNFHR